MDSRALPLSSGPAMSVSTIVRNNPRAFVPTDMTTVTAVVLNVTRPDGSSAVWACTIVFAEWGDLQASHAIEPGDLTVIGVYRARPACTVPAGVIFGVPFLFPVERD